MTSVSSEITNLQNQTSYNKIMQSKNSTTASKSDNDSSMFLTLMLHVAVTPF